MRTPATHARHDRPDSQLAAAPLLACTHREDLSRRARGLHCGPTARRASASGGVRLAAPHRTRGGRPHPRREQARRLPQGHAPARSAESRGGAPSRQRRVSGEVGAATSRSAPTRSRSKSSTPSHASTSTPRTRSASCSRSWRPSSSLRPSSSSGAAQGSDLKRPYDAGTLRLDSSEMADRLEWKDYPILFIYPP